jgi:hypothetical protein
MPGKRGRPWNHVGSSPRSGDALRGMNATRHQIFLKFMTFE